MDLIAEILEIASGNKIFSPCSDRFKTFKWSQPEKQVLKSNSCLSSKEIFHNNRNAHKIELILVFLKKSCNKNVIIQIYVDINWVHKFISLCQAISLVQSKLFVMFRAGQIFEIFKCFKCFKKYLKNVSNISWNIWNIWNI